MLEALELEDVIATAGVVIVDGDEVLLIEHGEDAGHITGAWGYPWAGSTATRRLGIGETLALAWTEADHRRILSVRVEARQWIEYAAG